MYTEELLATTLGVPLSVRLINGMLSDRSVYSEWKREKIPGKINRGCPQKGVISPTPLKPSS